MEIRFSYLSREKRAKQTLRLYYSVLRRIREFYLLDLGLIGAWIVWYFCGRSWLSGIGGLVILIFYYRGIDRISFAAWWRQIRNMMRQMKAFEIPGEYLLTDEYIEIRRGENVTKLTIREAVTGFYCRNGELILLCDKLFVCAFYREAFPAGRDFDEFAALFRNGGFTDHTPFPFRRALLPWALGAVFAAVAIWREVAG